MTDALNELKVILDRPRNNSWTWHLEAWADNYGLSLVTLLEKQDQRIAELEKLITQAREYVPACNRVWHVELAALTDTRALPPRRRKMAEMKMMKPANDNIRAGTRHYYAVADDSMSLAELIRLAVCCG